MRPDRTKDQLGETVAAHIFSWEDFYVEFQCSCGRFAMSGSKNDARQAWGVHVADEIRKDMLVFVRPYPDRPTQKWTWNATGGRLWITPDRKGVELEGIHQSGPTYFSLKYATWLVEALGAAVASAGTPDG